MVSIVCESSIFLVWRDSAVPNMFAVDPAWPLTSKSARTRKGGVVGGSNFNTICAVGVYIGVPNFIKIGCVIKKCGSINVRFSKKQRGDKKKISLFPYCSFFMRLC